MKVPDTFFGPSMSNGSGTSVSFIMPFSVMPYKNYFMFRFSMRSALTTVTMLALAIILFRDLTNVRSARLDFSRSSQAWLASRITLREVVTAADRLYKAEEVSVWTSRTEANRRQANRLEQLADMSERMQIEMPPARRFEQDTVLLELRGTVARLRERQKGVKNAP
ncbi:hypothetical protein [Pirellulimonas nuda]|uniref:hypothetical protein n=1 Tax=Pirellulimonas nuda TaxID=2528009 RepID=UPI0011A25814|nr:hypothetical protein [Pirellulimonas nuda]